MKFIKWEKFKQTESWYPYSYIFYGFEFRGLINIIFCVWEIYDLFSESNQSLLALIREVFWNATSTNQIDLDYMQFNTHETASNRQNNIQ